MRVEREATMWGKILAVHVSNKAVVYWTCTEILLIYEKIKNNEKRQRDISQKKVC